MQTAPADRVVRRIFQVWSTVYDSPVFQQVFYRRVHATLVPMLEALPRPETVVDLGCGTGQLTRDLVEMYPDATVIGADLSREMMMMGRKGPGDAEPGMVQANVYALPFADGSVDLMTNTISYHWYLDHRQALAEIIRVLAPGGHFAIATLTSSLFHSGALRRAAALTRQRMVVPKQIAADLEAAGLRIVDTANVFPFTRVHIAQRPAARSV